MFIHYIKAALRQLLKYKFHTLVSALCMAVGLTINGYMGVITQVMFNPIDLKELYKDKSGSFMNGADYKQVSERGVGIEKLYAIAHTRHNSTAYVDNDTEFPYQININAISPLFFRNYSDVRGNLIHEGRDSIGENEIIITSKFAKRIFGKESPIGKSLTLTNDGTYAHNDYTGKSYRIAGVTEVLYTDIPENTIYVPMLYIDNNDKYKVCAYCKKGFSEKKLQESFDTQEWKSTKNGEPFKVVILPERDYGTDFWANFIALTIFSLLIFLTGLINFTKFVIQMFYARQRELALRKCLGSSNRGLYMLLASEVIIMLTFSFLLSCITSELSVAYMEYMSIEAFEVITLKLLIVAQAHTTLIAMAVVLIIIIIPILKLRRTDMNSSILRKRRSNKVRNIMIGLQCAIFIICFSLLGVAIMAEKDEMSHHLKHQSQKELDRVFCLHPFIYHWDEIRQEIEKLPVVESFVYCSNEKFSKPKFEYSTIYTGSDTLYVYTIAHGDPRYFEFFDIPVNGKIVDKEDGNYVYIDQVLQQRLLQNRTFDGTINFVNGAKGTVAGVIESRFTDEGQNVFVDYVGPVPYAGSIFVVGGAPNEFYYRIKDGVTKKEAMKAFKEVINKYLPRSFDSNIMTLQERLYERNQIYIMMKHFSYIMAFISLLVVVLSIYSTISLDAVTRQKDIAIRKINGAGKLDIVRHFILPYLITYGVTFIIVYPLLVNSFLLIVGEYHNFLSWTFIITYGIAMFIGTTALLIAITWHKISLIMKINPAEVIRRE